MIDRQEGWREGQPSAEVWVVAGCLFEVVLPAGGPSSCWRWTRRPEVTLLTDAVRGGSHHFRFRAEAAGANAADIELSFRGPERIACTVPLRIAPERPS